MFTGNLAKIYTSEFRGHLSISKFQVTKRKAPKVSKTKIQFLHERKNDITWSALENVQRQVFLSRLQNLVTVHFTAIFLTFTPPLMVLVAMERSTAHANMMMFCANDD